MPITFFCKHCGRSLTTSDDRAGQNAKCPGCGETITVPVASAESLDTFLPADDAPADVGDAVERPPATATKTCPMCGAENPRTARNCQACGEPFADRANSHRRTHESVEIGSTLQIAWEIFKENLGPTVGGSLIYMIPAIVMVYALVAAGFIVIVWIDEQKDELLLALAIALPVALVSYLSLVYLSPGFSRMMLDLARGQPTTIGTLFSGGRYFLRSLITSTIFFLGVGIGSAMCLLPGVLLFLLWWPYLYVLIDEDAPGLSCLSRSKELMRGHWGQVLLIAIVGFAINQAAGICCVLQIFTQAYLFLLLAVTYVRITGQLTAKESNVHGIDE